MSAYNLLTFLAQLLFLQLQFKHIALDT